jgi:two-component sensor histidine kinase
MTGLALLLHELATNAVKYGALSSADGCIDIELAVGDGKLVMTWKEKGGPPLAGPPDQQGFGSMLAVTGQFGGELSYDWNAHGLIIRVLLPWERLMA